MELRIKVLSGILAAGMFFPCLAVKAEDEYSAEAENIIQKIEKNVGVMSYSTRYAWDAYMGITRGYIKYSLSRETLTQFYNALLKLEQNVQRMPIINSNLMNAIYALYSCYSAFYEETCTNYDIAHDKWERTLKMYSSLSLEMKDTRYFNIFNFMINYCKSRMKVCSEKEFALDDYYSNFFSEISDKLKIIYEKPPEERSDVKINFLEDNAIYEFLEPLRFFRNHREPLSADEFIVSLNQCVMQFRKYNKIFKYMNAHFPGFGEKLKATAHKFIGEGDDFKKGGEYSSAIECYYMARIFLRLSGNRKTGTDYSYVCTCILSCEKLMRDLGEDARF